jgi:Protein of unknown function (DUF3592)
MAVLPLSSPSRPAGPALGCLVVFFSLFALVGAAGFWLATVKPVLEIFAAHSWRQTSCIVLSSQVAESSGGSKGGTTYKPDVLYAYSVDGRSYQSRQYRFGDVYSSGREGKEKIVASLPPGTRTACWVDPADPSRAVIQRDLSPALLVGLFPLVFLALGAGGVTWVLHGARTKSPSPVLPTADPAAAFGVAAPAGGESAPVELHPTATPLGKFVGLTFIALFWNGIVSVFLVQIYRTWGQGSPDGCAILFLVPFVLVGLFLVFAAVRQLLVLFNPRVHLTLNPGTLTVGGIGYLDWRLSGRGAGVRRLRILLEGREEAWYRSGKSTHTDRNTFASVVVADTAQPLEIPAGNARVDVPEATVPSFKADHNKVIWSLKVTCDIPGWPDSEDEYEVLVRPSASGGGPA